MDDAGQAAEPGSDDLGLPKLVGHDLARFPDGDDIGRGGAPADSDLTEARAPGYDKRH
jgi:hypothetical protein